MQEYYRFEHEMGAYSFQRFQSMIPPTGEPAYCQPFSPMNSQPFNPMDSQPFSPFPQPQDPPPPLQPQDPPPPQSQDPPSPQTQDPRLQAQHHPIELQQLYNQLQHLCTQIQYASNQSQYPTHSTQYKVSAGIQVPQHSQHTVSPDTVIDSDGIRCHEIEDEEECNEKEPKPKRKASTEAVDNLKKAKLDQVEPINVKAK